MTVTNKSTAIPPETDDQQNWHWCWPNPGPTPVNQSLDAEIFDGDRVPLSETVVREAIQNSLDARLALNHEAVEVRINFHEETKGPQIPFLQEAMDYRAEAGLPVPTQWKSGIVSWMTVEDFASSGLKGTVKNRTGDFWNYWLNFGLSNKSDNARGGRGIGRVTFLIASTVSTVLGYTKRHEDSEEHACGMTVLRAGDYNGSFRSTHAYLAKGEAGSVYHLHSAESFKSQLCKAFKLRADVDKESDSGLSLVMPYPNSNLSEDGILASVIEHFGPAVLRGHLIVSVGMENLNADTLPTIAKRCGSKFSEPPLEEDPNRYVRLLHAAIDPRLVKRNLVLEKALKGEISKLSDHKDVSAMLAELEDDHVVAFDISFPLNGLHDKNTCKIEGVALQTPRNRKSIDMFFRDGMYLPLVRSRSPRGYDMLLNVDDPNLSDYLNLCEGKAHLDLLENAEVREKLKAHRCAVTEKRLVKHLPEALRLLFVPEVTEPDSSVFADIFNVPSSDSRKRTKKPKKPNPKNDPNDPPKITARISPFVITDIAGGMQIKTNPDFSDWPTSMRMSIAYADGSRKPKWHILDFDLEKMSARASGCDEWWIKDNIVYAALCDKTFLMDISGFDTNRELDTRIHRTKNPSGDNDA